MKKLAEFLINRRRVLTAVMLVLTAACAVLALRVPINRDRTKYLADSSEMKQGLSIMEDVFPESDETASIRVMFDDLTADQIPEIKAQLEAIPNVSGVTYEAGSEDYNKDNHTLFVVNSRYDYDTDEEHAIEAAIEEGFPGYTMAYENNDVPATELPLWVVVLALTLAVIILLVMSDSWLDPVLFLVTIGVAVVLNMGTNILFPYVDEMTATVGPILQLVLSMDYSIILMNRYRQEKVTHSDKVSAMKTALAGSVSSIASSSLTTVVGLLALVFLSFKLGPELGIVLAKGVFISMLCAFTVLPAMILAMDPLLEKTRKNRRMFRWRASQGSAIRRDTPCPPFLPRFLSLPLYCRAIRRSSSRRKTTTRWRMCSRRRTPLRWFTATRTKRKSTESSPNWKRTSGFPIFSAMPTRSARR